ncbi:EpsG family protein [Acinetobacter sp. YH12140]|uniref:EpsG family protein n=1 Tax=Acinetobacter sp. YH12140 TaxID=2601124 RepID=UPI0015D27380|nr:EpsG family protein [Acinetobacter sp. YH12140]
MKSITIRLTSLIYLPIVIFFSLIASLRGDTPDTYNYKIVYENIFSYSLAPSVFYGQTYMEVGFAYLAYPFKYFDLDFRYFLFFYSILIFYFIKKTSNNFNVNPVYVVLCYSSTFYFYHQWMQIRQGLAVVLGFYFLSLIYTNRRKILASLAMTSALFTHTVVSPFLFFLILRQKKIKRFIDQDNYKFIFMIITLMFVSFAMCRFLMVYGISYIDRIQTYSTLEETRDLFHPANLRGLLLLVVFLIFRVRNSILSVLIMVYAIGISFRFGFYDFLILSGRLSNIFCFAEIFIIPLILKLRFDRFFVTLLVIIYSLFSLYFTLELQLPNLIENYFSPLP